MTNKKLLISGLIILGILVLGVISFITYSQFTNNKISLINTSKATPEKTVAPTPTPTPTPKRKEFKNIKAKAIYLSGELAKSEKVVDKMIKLINETELNAIVLDIKEDGRVNYQSNIEDVIKYNAINNYYNARELVKKFHDNDIYVIGRLVCFKDTVLPVKNTDTAIKSPSGNIWRENGKLPWVNPYNEYVWDYNIEIAKEAIDMGFNEIQFDYVRFPAAPRSQVYYGENPGTKVDAINNFLARAVKEIHEYDRIPISADIFGIVCESKLDGELIGQDLEKIVTQIDYICPMIYPSHYANASNGICGNGVGQTLNGVHFTAPDLEPYKVLYNSLITTKNRIAKVPEAKAKVRTYLQDFTASYLPNGYYQRYGGQQLREQIQAVYDAGYEEWILWNAASKYSESGLLKE